MAYPFLPVNPCCTDIVLNSPCGCSSTTSNNGCGQSQCGTNVILSSNVLYNGPVLDCIIAEPCDTLNVILQKIDEIICNLLIQINTLNIQVANITNQIININNQVTNINNTLDVCCNVTTTTTTTILVPTTTSTTTATPTSTTTSSSSSTSTSTTTTTIAPTTTTTTTSLGYSQSFGAGFEDSVTACLETTGSITLYTNTPIVSFSSTFYNDSGLTSLFDGGGLWYKEMLGTGAWRIGASGNPLGSALC